MALVKKPRADGDVALASHAPAGVNAAAAREADAQRRRVRTLAKQQQASERISAAATELAAGINEASSASEELKRASDQIATGSEEASAAAQESLAALTQVTTSIVRQLQAVNSAQKRAVGMQEQAAEINSGVKALVDNLTLATERQAESVKMVAELERQASNIGDIVNALGQMQFQDVNRQLLEQVESALGALRQHAAALYELVGDDAPPPPQKLRELLDKWSTNYVSHEQRAVHEEAMGGAPRTAAIGNVAARHLSPAVSEPAIPEPQLAVAGGGGPKIELF
ncbi:MAG: hypothetical protein RLZ58_372 [Pseudomonadota bacterium]